MKKSNTICSAIVMMLLTAAIANGAVFNLTDDWSDAQNPNGAWSLYKNPTSLFTINQPDYMSDGTNQKAWADQPYNLTAHVPFWLKHDIDAHIYMHGAELDRTGSDVTFVRWTSPEAATVTISGLIWSDTNHNRTMGWDLRYEGTVITDGTIVSDGSHPESNPILLSQGSGGSSVLTFDVQAGETIDLVFTTISEGGNLGDTLELDFTLTTIPEPATICLLGIGALSLVRRKK